MGAGWWAFLGCASGERGHRRASRRGVGRASVRSVMRFGSTRSARVGAIDAGRSRGCGPARIGLRLGARPPAKKIVDFLQRSSRGLMISAWQPGLAVDMSAWRGARELPRSPPREPPIPPRGSRTSRRRDRGPRSSPRSSPPTTTAHRTTMSPRRCCTRRAPRSVRHRGLGAVGRPAGVTRRAPPLHAYVSSLTGEPCAPLGQDDTTPRHRCATSGVTTAYAHEHRPRVGPARARTTTDRARPRWTTIARYTAPSAPSVGAPPPRAPRGARRARWSANGAGDHSRTVRRGPACHLPRNLNGCHDNNQNFWFFPDGAIGVRGPCALCVDACAAVLRVGASPAMDPALVDETMDRCALGVGVLAMCLAAGATKLRLRDFAAVPTFP